MFFIPILSKRQLVIAIIIVKVKAVIIINITNY